MNLKRFFGKNSREALNMVRRALGENAVIISNRALDGGNEIIAIGEDEMNALATETYKMHEPAIRAQQPAAQAVAAEPQAEPVNMQKNEPITLLELLNKKLQPQVNELRQAQAPLPELKQTQPEVTHLQMDEQLLSSKLNIAGQAEHAIPNLSSPSGVHNHEIASILTEMRTMRSALESQLTTLSWSNMQQRDPVKSQILTTLLSAGFSASLSRQLAEKLPPNLDYTKALTWLKTVLLKNLNSAEEDNEILNQGGVFALIGPTGVGKTTTVAKLAARYVMKHGTQSLGLISTDAYRIGGHEQLRIYGKILGVMVYAVKDAADLQIALNELKHKHTVLIDTVGVSQRDQMVGEQIAMLSNSSTPIKRLLCLNATSTGETLANVVRAYKGKGLEGCIVTKTDEAATIGNALDAIIRERLKLFYVTNGQRVPEDIVIANKEQLIKEALNHESLQYLPYKFLADELPFVMGSTVNANAYGEAYHA
jgi:flagellar biosynthesis protein FlhF